MRLRNMKKLSWRCPLPWGPSSSALRNPLPKSPCVGEERRVGLGQALPIVGSRLSPFRRYYGQHAHVPLAATADDSRNVKVSDEDGLLSHNVTIQANNRIVTELSEFGSVEKEHRQKKKIIERICTNHVACKVVYQPVYPDTGAPLHEERVIAV